jgi:hypothetical protein
MLFTMTFHGCFPIPPKIKKRCTAFEKHVSDIGRGFTAPHLPNYMTRFFCNLFSTTGWGEGEDVPQILSGWSGGY